MIPVILWSNHDNVSARDQWDFGLLRLMFDGALGTTKHQFEILGHHTMASHQAIFVVPARHHASAADVAALNDDINAYDGVVIMLIGDEEAVFPWRDIEHENARLWVMHPHPIKHADLIGSAFFLGTGFKEDTQTLLASGGLPNKDLLWSFTGQSTHPVRKRCVNGLKRVMARAPGLIQETPGFTQGVERHEYLQRLARSRLAPAPSGPCTPDTFRLYEALEAGCYPIVDHGPEGFPAEYWSMVYGSHPLSVIHDWDNAGAWIEEQSARWPVNANRCHAWWQQWKRLMIARLDNDLESVGARLPADPGEKPTVIITTSPIPSHPADEMLLETLQSVWDNLGSVPIIIACDGVRPEQLHLSDPYNEYVRSVCWRSNFSWPDVLPVVSSKHVHQAEIVRDALVHVRTPSVLVMEHDTPLAVDDKTDWDACIRMMNYGALDVLRFHHEAQIHPEHEHLMLDHETTEIIGVPVRRTVQWSQRPHLARTDYYRRILNDHFNTRASCFIEDRMHGIVQSNPSGHRIAIYHPEGTIRRSFHTDGRGTEPKFDRTQIFE